MPLDNPGEEFIREAVEQGREVMRFVEDVLRELKDIEPEDQPEIYAHQVVKLSDVMEIIEKYRSTVIRRWLQKRWEQIKSALKSFFTLTTLKLIVKHFVTLKWYLVIGIVLRPLAVILKAAAGIEEQRRQIKEEVMMKIVESALGQSKARETVTATIRRRV